MRRPTAEGARLVGPLVAETTQGALAQAPGLSLQAYFDREALTSLLTAHRRRQDSDLADLIAERDALTANIARTRGPMYALQARLAAGPSVCENAIFRGGARRAIRRNTNKHGAAVGGPR